MITREDIGGVHIKYLYHCPRQLWLYARGFRPEHLNESVQLGTALHETTYSRYSPVDLGAARLDHYDGQAWVHEIKHSARPTAADRAQARHYCHQLTRIGVPVEGAILHYYQSRRTQRLPYTPEQHTHADNDIDRAVEVINSPTSPPRPDRARCHGCSYRDYCWNS
ncbi:CRISPR-associated protein Cas4 [Saccharopolyspora subtropica]|uniref:CRISPR-associated protein Cas4 n=1 Tax=Saccharopolyspora thermophila TaxID=89367 RepID=A0A917K350_9PSEU|nr:CRISPR-associated protein Cas4 [Saccharopolyspora subtropica]GGI95161.1 CRISPR-associated protein Cas4 [Saccharopolyspora subtropica]